MVNVYNIYNVYVVLGGCSPHVLCLCAGMRQSLLWHLSQFMVNVNGPSENLGLALQMVRVFHGCNTSGCLFSFWKVKNRKGQIIHRSRNKEFNHFWIMRLPLRRKSLTRTIHFKFVSSSLHVVLAWPENITTNPDIYTVNTLRHLPEPKWVILMLLIWVQYQGQTATSQDNQRGRM
jgi:hypothetical protein